MHFRSSPHLATMLSIAALLAPAKSVGGDDPFSTVLAEGKTKKILGYPQCNFVFVESKDDITAGDGQSCDTMPGKAEMATTTTVNTFRLLKNANIPIAFKDVLTGNTFVAYNCAMIEYEVVTRRRPYGSYLKRNPTVDKDTRFTIPLVEFYLKTTNKKWEGNSIPCDDPLVIFRDGKAELHIPSKPLGQPFMALNDYPLTSKPKSLDQMKEMANQTFLCLENAWKKVGGELIDLKIEFGFNKDNQLVVADVIDNDSWRVLYEGKHLDKQVYRDGKAVIAKMKERGAGTEEMELANKELLATVATLYKKVAELTSQFNQ